MLSDNHVPEAGQAVNVDNDHEDQFEEFQGILGILGDIHAGDDATKARDSHQLKQREELEEGT